MADNAPLSSAIAALLEDQSGNPGPLFRAVLDALLKSTLLTCESDEDYLPLFTHVVEMFAYDADAERSSITGEEAIRRVAAGDYEGLVIDPAGKSFELSGEDIEDMFDIDGD